MALADPQTITIDGVAISFALISTNGNSSLYQSADGAKRLRVSWTKTPGRTRYLMRYEEDAISADPISAVNKKVTASLYFVVDQPDFGIDDARVVKIVTGMKTWLATSSGGLVEKVLGNEH
jgi:hypothetical protein